MLLQIDVFIGIYYWIRIMKLKNTKVRFSWPSCGFPDWGKRKTVLSQWKSWN